MKKIQIRRFAPLSYAGQEAINTLCTNLSFSGENVKKIMMTSSHASEGKSFLTMNLMRTMARYGKRVVLVDVDLRRSFISSQYGIVFEDKENSVGIAHFLAGMAQETEIVYSTNIPGAYMVPVGKQVSNPLQLLNTAKFKRLLDQLAQSFDYVLVDAPPIGTVIDAAEIAKYCDGSLLIVNYNAVHRRELIAVKEQLEQTGCPILGAVLNMVKLDSFTSKKYYYKSYYTSYEADRPSKPVRKSRNRDRRK